MKTNVSTAAEMAQLLLNYGVVKLSPEAPFTWASGLKSPIYCNNRDLLSLADDDERDAILDMLAETSNSLDSVLSDGFDAIVGVATGAIPWSARFAYMAG